MNVIYKDRRRSASCNPFVEAFLYTVRFMCSNLCFCHAHLHRHTNTQRHTHTHIPHSTPLITQLAFNCLSLTMKIPENYMKLVKVVLVSLLLSPAPDFTNVSGVFRVYFELVNLGNLNE